MNRKKLGILFFLLPLALLFTMGGCTKDIDDRFYAENGEVIARPLPIEYTLSEYDSNRNIYVDISQMTVVDAEKSALVLIDIWQNKFLDSLVINNINPLIEKFDAMGAKIIYAPSIEAHNENLLVLEESIQLFDDDRMDGYLQENDIQYLFYVGFDTFYCVLDKTNGIYPIRSRNKELNLFLIDEGALSYTREMKTTAIELLKKNDIGIVNIDVSPFKIAYPQNTIRDVFAKTKERIPPGKNFVMLFKGDSENQELEQFEKDLLKLNVPYGTVVNNRFYYQGRELSQSDYLELLRNLEIGNLYYAGFHLNNEILWSDFGLRDLYIEVRYNGIEGLPWPYIVNDLAFIEPSQGINPEVEKATIINHCRIAYNIMSTTLITGLKQVAKTGDLEKTKKKPLP